MKPNLIRALVANALATPNGLQQFIQRYGLNTKKSVSAWMTWYLSDRTEAPGVFVLDVPFVKYYERGQDEVVIGVPAWAARLVVKAENANVCLDASNASLYLEEQDDGE